MVGLSRPWVSASGPNFRVSFRRQRIVNWLKTAWLVVFGVPGKPVSWNHPGFRPGKTVYPRETPGISSSGAKNKIGGVLGHACADSGLKSWV